MSVIAIDGPAGAGKSTIARAVARALGWTYLDTGAMYRAVAASALQRGIAPGDADSMGALAESIEVRVDDDAVTVDGDDVGERIRSPEVTRIVSAVAAHQRVRDALVRQQRRLAAGSDVVMEGRDIGTAVFPDAAVKVFLTADVEERARRRCKQSGMDRDDATVAAIAREISARDRADAERALSPLVKARDAHEIDTTGLTIEEVTERIVELARSAVEAETTDG